jgi:hypothetical protein
MLTNLNLHCWNCLWIVCLPPIRFIIDKLGFLDGVSAWHKFGLLFDFFKVAFICMYHLLIGGHYSMVFEHFWNSFDLEDSTNNFSNLFLMCSYVVVGCLLEIIFQILGTVRLLTLAKPSKGIWPIAMGEVLYQLVNRSFVFSILQKKFNSFISS